VAMIGRVRLSITSPVEGYARVPSMLKVTQRASSRSSMLTSCLGGFTVASKTWRRWLWASVTRTSLGLRDGVSRVRWVLRLSQER
jgi:hypothetical protein